MRTESKRVDIYTYTHTDTLTHTTDSLCCIAETNTTL